MRNLKRTMSLALAFIMLLSMMVVGTSAIHFTDSEDIVNTEAVETLVALGIIKGKEDGSFFDPTGIITRAEMVKIICVALNGGKDPMLGSSSNSYSDTAGHWAAGYIEYCTTLGIIAGRGDGTFDPNATITGTEAAKMLLVAIGYDSQIEGFEGKDWELGVNVRANQKNLYEELSALNPSNGLTRDDAAQMAYNTLNAYMIEYDYKTVVGTDGQLTTLGVPQDTDKTLLSQKFDLTTAYGYLNEIAYDEDSSEYTYSFDTAIVDGEDVISFTSTADYTDLVGDYTKVLYKTTTSGITAYAVYSESKQSLSVTVGEITIDSTANYVEIGDKEYTVEGTTVADVPIYEFSHGSTPTDNTKDLTDLSTEYDPSARVILVSALGNTKIDYALVIPTSVVKVTYVGLETITAGGTSYDLEDDVVASGLAKDDYVLITASTASFDGKNHVEALDIISGTVDGLDGDGKALVDGTWYTPAPGIAGDTLALGEYFDLSVVGAYIYYAQQTSESSTVSDLVYVSAVGDVSLGSQSARLYFSDGSSAIVSISQVAADGGSSTADVTDSNKAVVGLYTYSVKDGGYRLTPVDGDNKAGFETYDSTAGSFTKATDSTSAKIGDAFIADDAVIFVDDNTDGVQVITGATLKDWNSNYTTDSAFALTNKVSGLTTVQVAVLADGAGTNGGIPSTSGESGNYGFVTSVPYTVKVDDVQYDYYTIWTGSESINVYDEDADQAIQKGDLIEYTDLGNSFIEESTKVGTAAALTGFGSNNIVLVGSDGSAVSGTTRTDDDTVILYINTDKGTGVTGGEFDLAHENEDGSYVMNIWYVAGDNGVAALLVYDVNNDIGQGNTTV